MVSRERPRTVVNETETGAVGATECLPLPCPGGPKFLRPGSTGGNGARALGAGDKRVIVPWFLPRGLSALGLVRRDDIFPAGCSPREHPR